MPAPPGRGARSPNSNSSADELIVLVTAAAGDHDLAAVLQPADDRDDLGLRLLDHAPPLRRHELHLFAEHLGAALGPLVGYALLETSGLRSAYALCAALTVSALLVLALVRGASPAAQRAWPPARS